MGGLGNDRYFVDNAADVVDETLGGTDTVITRVSYALHADADIELLRTSNPAGTAAINLTGNDNSQTIRGNAGANTLIGGGGNNTLDGGAGADTLIGGDGQRHLRAGRGERRGRRARRPPRRLDAHRFHHLDYHALPRRPCDRSKT